MFYRYKSGWPQSPNSKNTNENLPSYTLAYKSYQKRLLQSSWSFQNHKGLTAEDEMIKRILLGLIKIKDLEAFKVLITHSIFSLLHQV